MLTVLTTTALTVSIGNMKTIKVFRIGPLNLQDHTEHAIKVWSQFDAVKPTGRLDALYASPSLKGLVRWIRGVHLANPYGEDLTAREITVNNVDNLYVYSIDIYDKVAAGTLNHSDYWNSGILMENWADEAVKRNLNPENWEMLLPVGIIGDSKEVTERCILNDVEEEYVKNGIGLSVQEEGIFLKLLILMSSWSTCEH